MIRLFLLVLAVLASAVAGEVKYYPIDIDQDKMSGAVDHSWLNKPLTAQSKIVVRDGRFHTVGGERVRMFGVNLAFGANFPTPADSQRIALRLRKLGVNLVRLHHMDTSPDTNPDNARSTLTTGPYPTLNPVSIARLRAFLDALKANGIYANLNLKVGYTFRPAVDGVPALPNGQEIPRQSKPLQMIHPKMIALECEYTRKLIDALKLRNDPVLAMIEINNESSIVYSQQVNGLEPYLVGDYRVEFQKQWNRFLQGKYKSTEALRAAWGGDDTAGPNVLGAKWTVEAHAPAQAKLIEAAEGPAVHVSKGGGWVYLKQVGFSISMGRPYLAEIEVRADLPAGQSRTITWDIKEDVSPWRSVTSRKIAITNQWQRFTMPVTPSYVMQSNGRFALSVESVEVPVYVRKPSLSQAKRRGLNAQETLNAANIALPDSTELGTDARMNDYLLFLADRDKAYLEQMLAAAREKVDAKVPVTGTQMCFGGLLTLDSHATLDYLDNHFYVDHYNFPNRPWDGRDWRFRDQSAIGSGMTSFTSMAIARDFAKPYTVSEFNQPWPNTHAAECDPTLAVFGAFQDWDSVMHFAYSHSNSWDNGTPSGFNLDGDMTKIPGFGQAAYLFRSGAIQMGRQKVEVPVSLDQRVRATRERRNGAIGTFLNQVNGYDAWLAFVHPVGITAKSNAAMPKIATEKLTGPYRADTGEFTYNREDKLFVVHAEKAAGVFGFAGTKRIAAGAVDVELASTARGFASVLVTPLDRKPLASSRHLLISNPGYTLRSQPGATPPRPQQIVSYQGAKDWFTLEPMQSRPSGELNSGPKPVWMEQVECTVTLKGAKRVTVYPLDGTGARRKALPASDVAVTAEGTRIHLQAAGQEFSPWYEVVVQ